jgi:hypothetical protein
MLQIVHRQLIIHAALKYKLCAAAKQKLQNTEYSIMWETNFNWFS